MVCTRPFLIAAVTILLIQVRVKLFFSSVFGVFIFISKSCFSGCSFAYAILFLYMLLLTLKSAGARKAVCFPEPHSNSQKRQFMFIFWERYIGRILIWMQMFWSQLSLFYDRTNDENRKKNLHETQRRVLAWANVKLLNIKFLPTQNSWLTQHNEYNKVA